MTQPNDVGPSESTKRLMLSPNDELIETIEKALKEYRPGPCAEYTHFHANALEWLRTLLEERKTHAPHGRNYTNEQYVNLRNQLDQLREETGMVNALTDADNLDLRTQLQQTREELEVERKTNEKYIEMYEVLSEESEQVKAELFIVANHLQVSNSQISDHLNINQSLRTELAAKNKVLEWYGDEGMYDQNEDSLVPEILDDRGFKASSILSQYKGEST